MLKSNVFNAHNNYLACDLIWRSALHLDLDLDLDSDSDSNLASKAIQTELN